MKFDLAKPIKLPVWKDPQNYVITKHVRDEAWIYFKCWQKPVIETKYIGSLHFEGVWAINSKRFLEYKDYPNVEENDWNSYYLFIEKSKFLDSLIAERDNNDPDWRKYDKRDYKHFVVESHDSWINIVSSKVSFKKIHNKEVEEYFKLWNEV